MQKFSVLMSIYVKENPDFARACFDSLLGQTMTADEWVIVEDGPLTPELYALLDEYQTAHPGLIHRVPLEKNVGLGLALREGIVHCSNELIARMDTDDICREDRFEKQLAAFEQHPELDICGCQIIEFEGQPSNELARRQVPLTHDQIARYQKRRDAFNHMTVMYKKSAVLKAGNYESCMLMEDTMLWVRMLLSGARTMNLDEYLVFARIGRDMFQRRGGLAYYKKYKTGRKRIFKTGYISYWDYLYTLMVQFAVAEMPNKLRGWVFTTLLHRS